MPSVLDYWKATDLSGYTPVYLCKGVEKMSQRAGATEEPLHTYNPFSKRMAMDLK